MGWVVMSERDIRRIGVLSEVRAGKRSAGSAAAVLLISGRQVRRLLDRLEAGGGAALAHRARGRPPNNKIAAGIQEYVLALIRERYPDFGPTLATEMLARHHGLIVSRETLRQWMAEASLWLSRRQRRTFHQPRSRREALGELIQIDGSEHRWFEDRGESCTLLVFIDDATGRLMQMRFVPSESTRSYFEALEGYLTTHGCLTCPLAAAGPDTGSQCAVIPLLIKEQLPVSGLIDQVTHHNSALPLPIGAGLA